MFTTPEFKVGLLVVVVSALIGGMSLKVAEGPSVLSGSKKYWFEVKDAGGLVKNSAVKMAGIKVGIIDDIKLVDGKAHVHIVIDDDVPMTQSAMGELKSDGILGDRHVELIPGKLADKEIDEGQIGAISDKASLDKVMDQIGDIASSLKEVSKVIEQATKEGSRETSLGRIISNIENLTSDLAQMTGENKEQIKDIVAQVHGITKTLDKMINDESPEGFKTAWSNAVQSLNHLDKTLENAEQITDKINRGEGTLGRLVNDEDTIEGVNTAISNVNEFLGGASTMETSIDFHSEFLTDIDKAKSYLNVKIQPGLDRYYILGVVDDPRGVTHVVDTSVNGGTSTTTTTIDKNKIKFNALFAKNFWDFTIKGGIMESAGGLGFDYHLLNRRLRISIEAFDFEDVNLRAFVHFQVFNGLYLVGGGDELANDDKMSTFIGAGIFITNDDLKTLASKISL
ncbi:MAG: MCE family protein [Bdellovibrionaceae bacterium]|nr:MCE family protein [Pseudobdellovibrionaceae bacterium]